jgi:conjugal transfer pilus assembly protein TraU
MGFMNVDKRRNIIHILCIVFLLLFAGFASLVHADDRPCINPISTVDWDFFFDRLDMHSDICVCETNGKVKVGLKWTVPEPIAFIEVVRKPYYFPCLDMEMSDSLKKYGTNYGKNGVKRNVHYIKYPVFGVLSLAMDYLCIDKYTQFDIAPPSEIDPRQNDDELSILFQPEKLLFANPIAQAICFADCISSSIEQPLNMLYWCAGCWGTIGTVATVTPGVDPVVESALLAVRQLDLLHADLQLWKYSNAPSLDYVASVADIGAVVDTICDPHIFPRIIKSQYWLNLAYPVVGDAIPIGDFGIKWSFFKQSPGEGEDFIWTVWRVRDCCIGFQYP